jgi:hypothetical protein
MAAVIGVAGRLDVGAWADRQDAQRWGSRRKRVAAAGELALELDRLFALEQKAGLIAQQFPRQAEHRRGGCRGGICPHHQAAVASVRIVAPSRHQVPQVRRTESGLIEGVAPGGQAGIDMAGKLANGIDWPAEVIL